MRRWDLIRYVLTSCVAGTLLAGCGGSQPPVGAPGTMAPTSSTASARSPAHRLSGSYRQLFRFHNPFDGSHPAAALLDVKGMLYGTTMSGGLSRKGIVYRISTSGVERVLYRFRGGSDGSNPQSRLIDVNGALYGTTQYGGASNAGTVYSISTSGKEKVLYAFNGGSDGAQPLAGLIDENGTLYGTTSQGGGSGCNTNSTSGCGTVFSITTSGQETVLYRFAAGSDGAHPSAGDLTDVKGVLYGTTTQGGGGSCEYFGYSGCGTVYSITLAGMEKVVYAFKVSSSRDAAFPDSSVIDVNNTLYGTTEYGGLYYCYGSQPTGCGTVYSIIMPVAAENVIYEFGGPNGEEPRAGLIDIKGVFYGTTTFDRMYGSCSHYRDRGCGIVFSITPGRVFTVLYRFAGGTDGFYPAAPLTNVNGTLYGTTERGGNFDRCCRVYGYGTVFSLTP